MRRTDIKTITFADTPYAVQWGDACILVDATGGAVTVTLPPVATSPNGRELSIKKIDASGNAVTVDGNGAETIDGAATASLAAQWDSISLKTNQAAWFILATI